MIIIQNRPRTEESNGFSLDLKSVPIEETARKTDGWARTAIPSFENHSNPSAEKGFDRKVSFPSPSFSKGDLKELPSIGSEEKIEETDRFSKHSLSNQDLEELRAIDKEWDQLKQNPPDANYLIKLQKLIGEILATLIQDKQLEQKKKHLQEEKYVSSNAQWGVFQREIGNRGPKFTFMSLALMALQYAVPSGDAQFVSMFAKDGMSNILNMFNTATQSQQKMVEGISQLALAEINAMMNKGSADASTKQEMLSILEKGLDLIRMSARGQ